MKVAVVYTSKYGSTKKYAEWIADEINADIYNMDITRTLSLDDYDAIVYGGGLYNGKIRGLSKIIKSKIADNKKLIVFVVGISFIGEKIVPGLKRTNLGKCNKDIPLFFLTGNYDYCKLSFSDRMCAKIFKCLNERMEYDNRASEDWKKGLKYAITGAYRGMNRTKISLVCDEIRKISD